MVDIDNDTSEALLKGRLRPADSLSKLAYSQFGSLLGICLPDQPGVCLHPTQMQGIVKGVAEQQSFPERKKLGGTIKTADNHNGVSVFWVAGGGVLEQLGVKIGDRVTAVNGNSCSSANEFFQLVGFSDPAKLKLGIDRNGEKITLQAPVPE